MTTFVTFQPNLLAAFQFSATFDNKSYTVSIVWNLFAQRYYVYIFDQNDNQILLTPRTGSPDNIDIDLLGPLFNSSLVYRVSSNQFEISP